MLIHRHAGGNNTYDACCVRAGFCVFKKGIKVKVLVVYNTQRVTDFTIHLSVFVCVDSAFLNLE